VAILDSVREVRYTLRGSDAYHEIAGFCS